MAKILGIDKDFPLSEMYKQRPRIVDVDDAKVRIEKYFAMCAKFGYSPQYTGLVLVLGLENKAELARLRRDKEYSALINHACNVVEFGYERLLPILRNPNGVIFALKNFGWNDGSQPTLILSADLASAERKAAQLAALQALRAAQNAIECGNAATLGAAADTSHADTVDVPVE